MAEARGNGDVVFHTTLPRSFALLPEPPLEIRLLTLYQRHRYWDKLVNTNLKGVFNITRASIPHLTRGSTFVNVSSISGIRGSAQQAVYCTTKFGLIGFSKCMALELGPRGIRVNVVAPGYIDTPTNAGIVKGGEAVERMRNGNALGRLGTPEEVADVVAFLMGEESRYMNGSVLEIDGGIKMSSTTSK